MRVLLYGGCHALVLGDYLQMMFPSEMVIQKIINFELIRENTPFPYGKLREIDLVVFSPIERDGYYNTKNLLAECKRIGVKALCFPWLEWHGYTPGAQKGNFKSRFQWHLPPLSQIAEGYTGSFDDFCDEAIELFPSPELIDHTFHESTRRIASAEALHDTFFSLSRYISTHFASNRQFLIPDHPSRAVYLAVLEDLLREIGLSSSAISDRLALLPDEEPQSRWRMPVFPRTHDRLGLMFTDEQWIDDEIVPGRSVGLKSYLALYYYPTSVILRPLDEAMLCVRSDLGRPQYIEVPATARIAAARCSTGVRDNTYRFIEDFAESRAWLPPLQQFEINPEQWTFSWP